MSRIDADNINFGESFVVKVDSSYLRSAKYQEDKAKALSIVEQANKDAQDIVEAAKVQAELEANTAASAIKEEARVEGHKTGYEAGYQEGLAALSNEFSEKIRFFNDFIESSFEAKKRIIKSAHLDIVKLISEISNKICQAELDINEEILFNITKAAIDLLKEKETVTIIVNPLMREKIFEISEQIKSQNSLISNIKIVEDPSISPDGTIVEGLSGRIDSRISSQIEEITQKLLNDVQTASEDSLVIESDNLIDIKNDGQIAEPEADKDDSI